MTQYFWWVLAQVLRLRDEMRTHRPHHIKLGTPRGLGKANHLVNEFFRRAKENSKINLHILLRWRSLGLSGKTSLKDARLKHPVFVG